MEFEFLMQKKKLEMHYTMDEVNYKEYFFEFYFILRFLDFSWMDFQSITIIFDSKSFNKN
jgi:hypothetical protein